MKNLISRVNAALMASKTIYTVETMQEVGAVLGALRAAMNAETDVSAEEFFAQAKTGILELTVTTENFEELSALYQLLQNNC